MVSNKLKVEWKVPEGKPVKLNTLPTGAVFRFAEVSHAEHIYMCIMFPYGDGFGYLDLETGVASRIHTHALVIQLDARLVVGGEL